MTRLLVLQQLFNLSDEQMEFQLARPHELPACRAETLRPSPHCNTIWVVRERLVQVNFEHQIFAEVQRQLQEHGFRAGEGRLGLQTSLRVAITWRLTSMLSNTASNTRSASARSA